MPIYKTITVDEHTKALIWKIEEPVEVLQHGIELTEKSSKRFSSMSSEIHRQGFLSVRHLLAKFGYSDIDVSYDTNGKPHLNDGKLISITHSFEFSAVIISSKKVGIDIEKQREKITRIAPKFTPIEEYKSLGEDDLIRKLTMVWGAKESLYKLYGKKGIGFLNDIFVKDFDFENYTTYAEVYQGELTTSYKLNFLEFEGYTCVYAIAL